MDTNQSLNIFNPELLSRWQEVDSENWKTIVFDIVSVFFESTPSDYENLKMAIKKQDRKKTELYSHSLKSSHGNVGAIGMQQIFVKIEKESHVESWEILNNYIYEIDSLIKLTYPLLEKYRLSLQNK